MDQIASRTSRLALVAALAAASSIVLALVFGGWLQHGAAIILALSESGLSICF